MSIQYRLFNFDRQRGVFHVEYGPPGTGITRAVLIPNPITRETVHKTVIDNCPVSELDFYFRLQKMSEEELQTMKSLEGEHHITDAESLRLRHFGVMPVEDMSK